jgi:hypothetical protein
MKVSRTLKIEIVWGRLVLSLLIMKGKSLNKEN